MQEQQSVFNEWIHCQLKNLIKEVGEDNEWLQNLKALSWIVYKQGFVQGEVEMRNAHLQLSKLQERIGEISAKQRSELFQSLLSDYCMVCGEYLGCDCEGCGCACGSNKEDCRQ